MVRARVRAQRHLVRGRVRGRVRVRLGVKAQRHRLLQPLHLLTLGLEFDLVLARLVG